MAKDDKKDVARAKSAVTKTRKDGQVRSPGTAKPTPKQGRKLEAKNWKATSKFSKGLSKSGIEGTGRDFETRSGKEVSNPKFSAKGNVKSGSNSISPVKQGVANKIKAQGAKMSKTPVDGYNRRGKK
jgi:hypothetical protein